MVSKEIIKKHIEQAITKCPTIAEMHQQLDSISYEERYSQLKENNLLNPLELDDYQWQLNMLDSHRETIHDLQSQLGDDEDDSFGLKDSIKLHERKIQEIEDEMFLYGRRLIEGLQYKQVPSIDKDSFHEDKQVDWDYTDTRMGDIERNQILTQMDNVNVDPNDVSYHTETYTNMQGKEQTFEVEVMNDDRLLAMDNYFNGDTDSINYTISHEGYLKALNNQQNKRRKNIDSLMDDSPGLLENTVLYRGGHWDIHLKPGDHTRFKGYMSTTFQKETADWYNEGKSGASAMNIIIHAPKGTKGICGNDSRFDNGFMEHEYVLPRNVGYTVLSIDYDTMTAEIVLDES